MERLGSRHSAGDGLKMRRSLAARNLKEFQNYTSNLMLRALKSSRKEKEKDDAGCHHHHHDADNNNNT